MTRNRNRNDRTKSNKEEQENIPIGCVFFGGSTGGGWVSGVGSSIPRYRYLTYLP